MAVGPNQNHWHLAHFVCTSQNNAKLYVDGEYSKPFDGSSGVPLSDTDDAAPARLGGKVDPQAYADGTNSDSYANYIDSVTIYKRELSAAEIAGIYEMTAPPR